MRLNGCNIMMHLLIITLLMCTAYTKLTEDGETLYPDMIILVVDDLGAGDTTFTKWGAHTGLYSPNINRIADSGVVLAQFYAQPSCTPTRAALLTGLYPLHTGMQDFVIKQTAPISLPNQFKLLPQYLKEVGYHTALVGKWHLGFCQLQNRPSHRGFNSFYGMYTGDADHYTQVANSRVWVRGFEGLQDVMVSGIDLRNGSHTVAPNTSMHSTERYTNHAVDVISLARQTEPLFLLLSYQAVHFPMQAEPRFLEHPNCSNLTRFDSIDVDMHNRAIVCGMLIGIDESVARIEETIRAKRRWENTVLILFSDNGGDPKWGSLNEPFKGYKDEVWEGGVRVPAFFAGGFLEREMEKASVDPHTTFELMHVTDIFATILHICNIDTSSIRLDGVNQWQTLVHNKTSARKEVVININSDTFLNGGALRIGDYKYILEYNSTVHNTVSAVMAILAQSEMLYPKKHIHGLVRQIMGKHPKKYIFNVVKNPSERCDGDCDDVEKCANLYSHPRFQDTRTVLERRYEELVQDSAPAVFEWQDDGPLASPYLFNGYWSTWRDSHGVPYSIYGLKKNSEACESTTAIDGIACSSKDATVSSVRNGDIRVAPCHCTTIFRNYFIASGVLIMGILTVHAYKFHYSGSTIVDLFHRHNYVMGKSDHGSTYGRL